MNFVNKSGHRAMNVVNKDGHKKLSEAVHGEVEVAEPGNRTGYRCGFPAAGSEKVDGIEVGTDAGPLTEAGSNGDQKGRWKLAETMRIGGEEDHQAIGEQRP